MSNNRPQYTLVDFFRRLEAGIQALKNDHSQTFARIERASVAINQQAEATMRMIRAASQVPLAAFLVEAQLARQRRERQNRLRQHEARMYLCERNEDW